MSCYFSVYICDACKQQVPIGWMGLELNLTVACCTACSDSFRVHPKTGETLLNSTQSHSLVVFGKKSVEVSSKKGRIKKMVSQAAWIDSGIRIPVHEDIVQRGDDLYLVYTLIFDDIDCPSCQTTGSLVEYTDYVKNCPQCKVGTMSEYDL